YGQLGNATVPYKSPTSVRVSRFTDNAVQIEAGGDHSMALDRDGSLWTWGENSSGQLGNGVVDNDPPNLPVHLAPPTLPGPITPISAGGDDSLAVLSGGGLWMWGDNFWGQVDPSLPRQMYKPAPTPIPLSDVRQASLGWAFGLAVVHRVGVTM